jgi:transposase
MPTLILYHAFGLKGIHYESTQYVQDSIVIGARLSRVTIKWPHCGSKEATFKDQKRRLFRMGPMGRKRCFLILLIQRLECRQCGRRWWPEIPFTDGKHRYVRSFALTLLDLLKFGTIRAVAAHLGVGWDMVKEIHKDRLSQLYGKMQLREVRYIGGDEFSIRKGHEYMTIFRDLQTLVVIMQI